MTISEFKPILLSKSVGRTALPTDAELYARIYTALKKVAKHTIPLRLSKQVEDGILITFPVFRRVDEKLYVRLPSKPVNDDEDLDIDEALTDAVALYIMAGLERANAKTYMGMYWGEIDDNNDRLIETEVLEANNECADRFRAFP
jgi:hypothetical protein